MKKVRILERLTTPDGSLMQLVERDGHHMIWVNGRELMSSRHPFSEEQLGVLGCEPLKSKPGAVVLIGGLGLGFTLRAALRSLRRDASVVVAELLPEVVTWNREPQYGLAREALEDPRVQVSLGDVAKLIEASSGGFDAILLDADNETTAMNTKDNSKLYRSVGLSAIGRALRPQGHVVYWSAFDDPRLVERLTRAGFHVEVHRVPKYEGARGGGKHVLVMARARASSGRRH